MAHRDLCGAHYQAAWKAGSLPPLPERVIARACPDDHKHALTTTCYRQHGCRCTPCYEKRSAERQADERAKAYGRYDSGMVDAGPVRDHVFALAAAGIGRRRLVELSGVSPSAISALRTVKRGKLVKRVRSTVGAAILAVPLTIGVAGGAKVPSRGTARRLQALIARGWSQQQLSTQLGLTSNNLPSLFRRDAVTQEKADAVAALYERLWDAAPPADTPGQRGAIARSLATARRRGWPPPLAWDDIDLDDGPAQFDGDEGAVDHVAVTLALAGDDVTLNPAERRECVRILHRERWSDTRIAEQIRCSERTVLRIRGELDLPAFDQSELVDRRAA